LAWSGILGELETSSKLSVASNVELGSCEADHGDPEFLDPYLSGSGAIWANEIPLFNQRGVPAFEGDSMTLGGSAMATRTNIVRVQQRGQVTLPSAVRRRLGIKKGDLVAVTDTPEGILITPREVVASLALDRIGAQLQEQGLSLEELIESGRDERDGLIRELYGLDTAS
jgi:AbrB family looped-hinge helix DNA binding protein